MQGRERTGRVQAVDRALVLLDLLADRGGRATITELAEDSGLPGPTIHRLMNTLRARGYVRQEPSRHYALGVKLVGIGETAGRLLGDWVTPALSELVERTGETANMAMLDGDQVVYLAQVPSRHSMRMFTEVGRRLLPHGTGVGKAMLATLAPDDARALLQRTGMPAYTEHTHTDIDSLLDHLAEISEQGYALDSSEQELGVRCIAAAVPGAPAPTAVSVSGPEGRLTDEAVRDIAPAVRRTAARLAEHLVQRNDE